MLISPNTLSKVFKVNPNRILHVGAHLGEESQDYGNAGWGTSGIDWIEVQPDLVKALTTKFENSNNNVIHAAVWSTTGIEMEFKSMTNSQSSSLYDLGKHAQFYPDIQLKETYKVITKRIDGLFTNKEEFDFVNLDLQGAELEAIKGMGVLLQHVKWIYCEVNWVELYRGCALIGDLDKYLEQNGFKRVATYREPFVGWGDALYIRTELKEDLSRITIVLWKATKKISKSIYAVRHLAARILKIFR